MNIRWVSIKEYAKKVNKSVPQVYLDVRHGKIKNKIRKVPYQFVMKRTKTEILIKD